MTFTHILKIISKNSLIYIIITLIPSVTISYLLAQHQEKDDESQNKSRAQWYANFHAMNIDNFFGETIGRLEMLSTSIKIQHQNLEGVGEILQETHERDPRFSGFYWSNIKGDLLISSNPTSSLVNVGDRPYFQQALKTQKTIISEPHIGRVTGRFIVTIATPIVENGKIQGLLLASLSLDEIEDKIKSLLNDEWIIVTDRKGKTLINTSSITSEEKLVKSSMAISEVPWTTTAFVISENNHVFRNAFINILIIIFTITNILFLLFKYLLLRRKVKKEQEQIEFQKLELIGNLAASTAHEIRNPLTGIKGLIKLLSEENPDQKSQLYFEVIQTEIDRINLIVSELLVLGKPTAHTLIACNANNLVKEIEPIIHSEANYVNVKLTINYSAHDLLIFCVKEHIKQVILNLTKNALHAMPNGGILTITLEKRLDSCLIKVEDNGIGMPKEYLRQAFNPFFTMKKDGSGLGLTVCKRIVTTIGGSISIDSTLHEGTIVEITLPLILMNK